MTTSFPSAAIRRASASFALLALTGCGSGILGDLGDQIEADLAVEHVPPGCEIRSVTMSEDRAHVTVELGLWDANKGEDIPLVGLPFFDLKDPGNVRVQLELDSVAGELEGTSGSLGPAVIYTSIGAAKAPPGARTVLGIPTFSTAYALRRDPAARLEVIVFDITGLHTTCKTTFALDPETGPACEILSPTAGAVISGVVDIVIELRDRQGDPADVVLAYALTTGGVENLATIVSTDSGDLVPIAPCDPAAPMGLGISKVPTMLGNLPVTLRLRWDTVADGIDLLDPATEVALFVRAEDCTTDGRHREPCSVRLTPGP